MMVRHNTSLVFFFFFSSRRRHTRCSRDWSSDVCSSDLEDRLEAQQLEVEMLPEFMAPKVLTATGDVKAQSSHRGESRSLATSALRFYFVDPTKPREQRLGHAETLAPATIEWQRPNAPGGNGEPQTIRLRGRQIAAEFGERNEFRNLTGRGDVGIGGRLPGSPPPVSQEQVFTFM